VTLRLLLVTRDPEVVAATKGAFQPDDVLEVYSKWEEALETAAGADLMFVDLLATLRTPNRIAGYERFAAAKMEHPSASDVPLVLISPPADYALDAMVGWPGFVFAHLPRPVSYKLFRRATTWV
jgi:hypothetical protein